MNREIDALLAEKVMGWPRYETDGNTWFATPEGVVCTHAPSATGLVTMWSPSTYIADAWTVLQKIKDEWLFSDRRRFFETLHMEIDNSLPSHGEDYIIAWPDALMWMTPRTIALAALKAVGVEVEA